MIPLNAPSIGQLEEDYVLAALRSGWVTIGPACHDLEAAIRKHTGRTHAVLCSSGTAALYLALRAIRVKQPSVLVPAYTCDAVSNAVIMAGLDLQVQDIEKDTFGLAYVDQPPGTIGAVVLPATYGVLPADTAYWETWCHRHGAVLIEDASEAHGAVYRDGRRAGKLGDVTIMSFRGEKTVSGGQLGVVLTDNPEIASRARQWSHNGLTCDLVRYWATEPGMNMQPSNLNAALALAQLTRLDELVAKRNAVHDRWVNLFSDIGNPDVFQGSGPHTPAWWLTAVKADHFTRMLPQDLGTALEHKYGIQTRPGFYPIGYYPHVPNSMGSRFPIAEHLLRTLLVLPSGPTITLDQQEQVMRAIGQLTGAW